MDLNDVLIQITSAYKWYVCSTEKESTRVRIQEKRISKGTAKLSTIKEFLNRFGYDLELVIKKI